jgi:hypothetical protein
MSSYFYNLYFTETVKQTTIQDRLLALPGIEPDAEFADHF